MRTTIDNQTNNHALNLSSIAPHLKVDSSIVSSALEPPDPAEGEIARGTNKNEEQVWNEHILRDADHWKPVRDALEIQLH